MSLILRLAAVVIFAIVAFLYFSASGDLNTNAGLLAVGLACAAASPLVPDRWPQ